MLKVVSSGSVLANVIPVRPGSSDSKSGWDRDWQPATASVAARTALRDSPDRLRQNGSSPKAQSRIDANWARISANVATARGNQFVSKSTIANAREPCANWRECRHVAVYELSF